MEERKQQLAEQVANLAKADLLASNHYLATALGRLHLVPRRLARAFSTNGSSLFFDPNRIVSQFKQTHEAPTRAFLHSVAHCLFLHPYVGASVDHGMWDLACDIVAERTVSDLLGPRNDETGAAAATAIARVERDLGSRANAEAIYRALKQGRWTEHVSAWRNIVKSDAHDPWYTPTDSQGGSGGQGAADGTQGSGGIGRKQGESDNIDERPSPSGMGDPDAGQRDNGTGNAPEGREGEGQGGRTTAYSPSQTRDIDQHRETAAGNEPRNTAGEQASWRDAACSLAAGLRASGGMGANLANLVQDLETASRKPVDYRAFLRRFATTGETMHVSDADFDYCFYTYGLQLFGDMPLVEPLEHREDKRVREFVVAIDTSESVQGDTIREFVRTTFALLKQTEGFFDRVQVHVLQCDNGIRSDTPITTGADLEKWEQSMRVRGGGGTDFRPVFSYVNDLVDKGEFCALNGLLYFTDGKGVYPERMPHYKTAFAFYPDAPADNPAPPWAIQFSLDDGVLEEAGETRVA